MNCNTYDNSVKIHCTHMRIDTIFRGYFTICLAFMRIVWLLPTAAAATSLRRKEKCIYYIRVCYESIGYWKLYIYWLPHCLLYNARSSVGNAIYYYFARWWLCCCCCCCYNLSKSSNPFYGFFSFAAANIYGNLTWKCRCKYVDLCKVLSYRLKYTLSPRQSFFFFLLSFFSLVSFFLSLVLFYVHFILFYFRHRSFADMLVSHRVRFYSAWHRTGFCIRVSFFRVT